MSWQPRHLTPEQLEERRRAAGRLLKTGRRSQADIARQFGVSRAAVCKWARLVRQGGVRALRRRPHRGRASALSKQQRKQLRIILKAGPRRAGFDTERWTLKRVARVIHHTFGVSYHPNYVACLLRQLHFSPQQPRVRAKERDDKLVEAWLKRDWPRIKRGLLEEGRPLPSWTKRVVRFGPARAPPGRRSATLPC